MINESLCSNLGLKWPAMVMVWCIVYLRCVCYELPPLRVLTLRRLELQIV